MLKWPNKKKAFIENSAIMSPLMLDQRLDKERDDAEVRVNAQSDFYLKFGSNIVFLQVDIAVGGSCSFAWCWN